MGSRKLSDSDLKLIKEYFTAFDKDQNGCITKAQLRRALQQIGRNPTEVDVDELMSELGVKGEIRYKEFKMCMRVMLEEAGYGNNEEDLREAFKVFDKDGNGLVDKKELTLALKALGEKLTDEELDELFAGADVNRDGQIDYEEFIRLML